MGFSHLLSLEDPRETVASVQIRVPSGDSYPDLHIAPLTTLNLHGKIQQPLSPAFHTRAMDAGCFLRGCAEQLDAMRLFRHTRRCEALISFVQGVMRAKTTGLRTGFWQILL